MVGVVCLYPLLVVREARINGSIDKGLDVGGQSGILPRWEYFGIGVTDQEQLIVNLVK